ncbi:MAG: N-acetylmuramic acid 6-phosphate etherase [Clostridium sp.]|nr:N-acetylmuramic acid 6-phosphate etherase [Clostridium sp.]
MINLQGLVTETRNPNTYNIDNVSTLEMVKIMNNEDAKVHEAIGKELNNIALAIDSIHNALIDGGRLIYVGAGTSGRLGILDASECMPTYGVSEDLIQGIIAGGKDAMFKAQEGAEDSAELCVEDLKNISFSKKDILCGLAASGRTPYVIGGVNYAKSIGAKTISVTCNPESELSKISDIAISPVVGPEVVTGSTRMKAGTAQKMVLNMLSTGSMIKFGKVYGNLMVDVQTTNKKLEERARKIVVDATGCSRDRAIELLDETSNNVKLSIFMEISGLSLNKSKAILDGCNGHIRNALKNIEGR